MQHLLQDAAHGGCVKHTLCPCLKASMEDMQLPPQQPVFVSPVQESCSQPRQTDRRRQDVQCCVGVGSLLPRLKTSIDSSVVPQLQHSMHLFLVGVEGLNTGCPVLQDRP